MQNIALLTLMVTASAALAAKRFVTVAGAPSAAGQTALGVTRTAAALGDAVAVDVVGTAQVEAGAAIAAGAAVEVGASGRAVTRTTGVTVGRALTAASAAGETIEVLLITN